jgi:diacylglycerol O-acyltransferase
MASPPGGEHNGAMRMSGTEALMWTVEKDPALRSDFVNLTILDGVPDAGRVRATAARAVAAIPRLAQRVVAAPLRIAPPEWTDDRDFDLDYHVRRVRVPSPGGMRELLDVSANLAEMPFDRSRPLWEFTVLEGLAGGRAALLQKIHHVIVDGVGGLKLSLAIVDLEREPGAPETAGLEHTTDDADEPLPQRLERLGPIDVLARSVVDVVGEAAGALVGGATSAARLAAHPAGVPAAVADAGRLADSLRRQLFVTGDARSPIMTERSLRRHFEVFSVPLDPVKAVARRHNATVNDVYVAGVAGALGAYHERMGAPVDELRMAMPVNLRDRAEVGGNRFAPLRMLVPTGPKDPSERLAGVRDALAGTRREPALGATDGLAGVAARLPTSIVVSFTRAQARTIDFATSNMRGSPTTLYLAGCRIEGTYPMGPRAGAAVNVTALSYCGDLGMGINLDPAAITDRAAFMAALDESFADLLGLAG